VGEHRAGEEKRLAERNFRGRRVRVVGDSGWKEKWKRRGRLETPLVVMVLDHPSRAKLRERKVGEGCGREKRLFRVNRSQLTQGKGRDGLGRPSSGKQAHQS